MIEPRLLLAAVVTATIVATVAVSIFADLLVAILPPGRPLAVVHALGYAVSALTAIVAYQVFKSRLPAK